MFINNAKPKLLNFTVSCIKACVPIIISAFPFAILSIFSFFHTLILSSKNKHIIFDLLINLKYFHNAEMQEL